MNVQDEEQTYPLPVQEFEFSPWQRPGVGASVSVGRVRQYFSKLREQSRPALEFRADLSCKLSRRNSTVELLGVLHNNNREGLSQANVCGVGGDAKMLSMLSIA